MKIDGGNFLSIIKIISYFFNSLTEKTGTVLPVDVLVWPGRWWKSLV